MLTLCVRNVLSRRFFTFKAKRCTVTRLLQHSWRRCSTAQTEALDRVRALLQICVDRCYVSPAQTNVEMFQRGLCCSYGPLGVELRRNLLDQWWHSVTRSRAQVFGIATLSSSRDTAAGLQGQLRIVEYEHLKQSVEQKELSKEQLIQEVHMLLQRSPSMRTNLLQGKLPHTCNK